MQFSAALTRRLSPPLRQRVLDTRARLLRAALGFVTLSAAPRHPALDALHHYLDSWHGVGAIAAGMAHQDFDLQLTMYDERGWRANFYPSGIAHSVVAGTGWATTPWRAVQRAAWQAVTRHDEEEIRARVQRGLANALLPSDLPKLESPPIPGEMPRRLIEAGSMLNDRCVVCEEIATHVRYNLADGPVAFHQRCHDIWKEEAFKAVNQETVADAESPGEGRGSQ